MKTNNYPNCLVSIEIAKKLKEIGFDKPTQNRTEDGLSIPTWEQVLEWFMEKGLNGFVLVDSAYPYGEIENFYFEIIKNNWELVYSSEDDGADVFDSYEAAREALIREMINIYLIKKSKK